jgi:hypothetical protein
MRTKSTQFGLTYDHKHGFNLSADKGAGIQNKMVSN